MRVAIFFGGRSVEHEISVISALQAYHAFPSSGYEPLLVYLDKENHCFIGDSLSYLQTYHKWSESAKKCQEVTLYKDNKQPTLVTKKGLFSKKIPFDLAFLIVHGQGVEDGTLSALFELYQIPYVGPSLSSGALGQDKIFSKLILKAHGIPVLPHETLMHQSYHEARKAITIPYPFIIKPAHLGSSIGIQIVTEEAEFIPSLDVVFRYDEKALIEPYVKVLREFNCAVCASTERLYISAIEEVRGSKAILTYQDKYGGQDGMASCKRVIPAPISAELQHQITVLSEQVYQVLECSGVVRIDFLYDVEQSKLYVNEINSIPGSLSYYLFEGILDFPVLLHELMTMAMRKEYQKQQRITCFDSDVFSSLLKNPGIKK